MRRILLSFVLLGLITYLGKETLFPRSQEYAINLTQPSLTQITASANEISPTTTQLYFGVPKSSILTGFNTDKLTTSNVAYPVKTDCKTSNNGMIECQTLYFDWHSKTDDIIFRIADDRALNIVIPIHIHGNGNIRQQKDRINFSDVRTFRTQAEIIMQVEAKPDNTWCLTHQITRKVAWQGSYRAEVFADTKINLEKLIQTEFSETLKDLSSQLAVNFPACDIISGKLSSFWGTHTITASTGDLQSGKTLLIKPEELAFSGFDEHNDLIRYEFIATLKSQYVEEKVTSTPVSLPTPVTSTYNKETNLKFPVTSHIAYSQIENEIRGYFTKNIYNTRNRFGSHSIQVENVKVGPAGERLALSILVRINHSDQWKETYGWLNLTIKPKPSTNNKHIILTDAKFTTTILPQDDWIFMKRALKETLLFKLNKESVSIPVPDGYKTQRKNIVHALNNAPDNFPWIITGISDFFTGLSSDTNNMLLNAEVIAHAYVDLTNR